MTDQLIHWETAKLAKEKGFIVGLRGYYVVYLKTQKSDNPSFRMTKGEIEPCSEYMVNNGVGDYSCKSYISYSAPTQSLLQRWLREEHKIISYVVPHTNPDSSVLSFCPVIALTKIAARMPYLPTWEEALEVALFESLKLIPC